MMTTSRGAGSFEGELASNARTTSATVGSSKGSGGELGAYRHAADDHIEHCRREIRSGTVIYPAHDEVGEHQPRRAEIALGRDVCGRGVKVASASSRVRLVRSPAVRAVPSCPAVTAAAARQRIGAFDEVGSGRDACAASGFCRTYASSARARLQDARAYGMSACGALAASGDDAEAREARRREWRITRVRCRPERRTRHPSTRRRCRASRGSRSRRSRACKAELAWRGLRRLQRQRRDEQTVVAGLVAVVGAAPARPERLSANIFTARTFNHGTDRRAARYDHSRVVQMNC